MAKWKILHLVGDDISIWRVGQIENYIEFLPDELFAQAVVVDKPRMAKVIEEKLLRKIICTGKRFGSELIAAHNLHKIIKDEKPDIFVCWDIQATEQLKLALLGLRGSFKIVFMLFRPFISEEEQNKLQIAYRGLNMNLLCNLQVNRNWISGILKSEERIYTVSPATRIGSETDKRVLRQYFNLGDDGDRILIYISPESKLEDMLKTLNAIGIVQPVYSNIRAVVPVNDDELAAKLIKFSRQTLIEDILLLREYNDAHLLLRCCDIVVIPRGVFSEHIETLEAMRCKIPVVISEYDVSDDLLIPNETFVNVDRFIPRVLASAIYKLISNESLQRALTTNAYELVSKNCTKLAYRSTTVKIYQQIMG